MSLPSRNASHTFSQVPSAEIQRSGFDRSHGLRPRLMLVGLFPFMLMKFCPVILLIYV